MAIKIIAKNRKARYNYEILDTLEVGIVLLGTEVKSLRAGRITINESYAVLQRGELFLLNANISPYDFGNLNNHDPMRTRKLLVSQAELKRLFGMTKEKGLTLIPLKIYWKDKWAKLEIGVGRGKKLYDKRATIKSRDWGIEKQRLMKENR